MESAERRTTDRDDARFVAGRLRRPAIDDDLFFFPPRSEPAAAPPPAGARTGAGAGTAEPPPAPEPAPPSERRPHAAPPCEAPGEGRPRRPAAAHVARQHRGRPRRRPGRAGRAKRASRRSRAVAEDGSLPRPHVEARRRFRGTPGRRPGRSAGASAAANTARGDDRGRRDDRRGRGDRRDDRRDDRRRRRPPRRPRRRRPARRPARHGPRQAAHPGHLQARPGSARAGHQGGHRHQGADAEHLHQHPRPLPRPHAAPQPASGVSRKIEDDEHRRRLREMFNELKPPRGLGFIMRTAADRQEQEGAAARPGLPVAAVAGHGAAHPEAQGAGRDLPGKRHDHADHPRQLHRRHRHHLGRRPGGLSSAAQEFCEIVMPRYADRIKLYDGKEPLFHKYGIEDEIHKIQQKKVPLPYGGSIVIEQTEALVAIDVNSGNFRADRQRRGDGLPDEPAGGQGDRPAAAAARPDRRHRQRLHRHARREAPPRRREGACATPCSATGRGPRSSRPPHSA